MPSTTTYKQGHVVVVTVSFTDQSGGKRRPALVVSAEAFHRRLPDVLVAPISSQPRYFHGPGSGDIPLRRWRDAGLRHPSAARLSNLMAVDRSLLGRVVGMIDSGDMHLVTEGLRGAFGL